MMSVGHVLDHVPDHVLDHMIIGLVTTALHIIGDMIGYVNKVAIDEAIIN